MIELQTFKDSTPTTQVVTQRSKNMALSKLIIPTNLQAWFYGNRLIFFPFVSALYSPLIYFSLLRRIEFVGYTSSEEPGPEWGSETARDHASLPSIPTSEYLHCVGFFFAQEFGLCLYIPDFTWYSFETLYPHGVYAVSTRHSLGSTSNRLQVIGAGYPQTFARRVHSH
ncbi:unnamed protein product [Kuraishia capsulata CBS 1993]|uniref:Uncharacterized protein n=1 Tax=Kuraishia capsulata CBS 1993 TaxID=1382522 RepID=W6MUE2_9ASCO|nr:uncharacterized protein KUCA_T00005174001 [Kuraishia capsulata CBS 1993]CDK29187.1 unnamed protein product [Kuraishia capsulata CBS 1993]